jgi:hypothetical protein
MSSQKYIYVYVVYIYTHTYMCVCVCMCVSVCVCACVCIICVCTKAHILRSILYTVGFYSEYTRVCTGEGSVYIVDTHRQPRVSSS